MNTKRAGFVVEHDFIMATYLADRYYYINIYRVVVYEGTPGKECIANAPEELLTGMNKFLGYLNITFRRGIS